MCVCVSVCLSVFVRVISMVAQLSVARWLYLYHVSINTCPKLVLTPCDCDAGTWRTLAGLHSFTPVWRIWTWIGMTIRMTFDHTFIITSEREVDNATPLNRVCLSSAVFGYRPHHACHHVFSRFLAALTQRVCVCVSSVCVCSASFPLM